MQLNGIMKIEGITTYFKTVTFKHGLYHEDISVKIEPQVCVLNTGSEWSHTNTQKWFNICAV